MAGFIPFNRNQAFLLPPDLRTWLPNDDLSRYGPWPPTCTPTTTRSLCSDGSTRPPWWPRRAVHPGRAGHAFDASPQAQCLQSPQSAVPRFPGTRPRRAHPVTVALLLLRRSPPGHPRRDHQDRGLQRRPRLGFVRRADDQERRSRRAREAAEYAGLVSNAVMLSNVAGLTTAIAGMARDGHPVTPALVASTSPACAGSSCASAGIPSMWTPCQARLTYSR